MSAFDRLREHVDYVFKDGELPESERMAHDLRTLLDAYDDMLAALKAARAALQVSTTPRPEDREVVVAAMRDVLKVLP